MLCRPIARRKAFSRSQGRKNGAQGGRKQTLPVMPEMPMMTKMPDMTAFGA